MEQADRRLKWHGIMLFLLGLFTGFAEIHFANVRMGLAAHLEGVMNGTFLLALGAAWPGIHLSTRMQAVAFWTVLYGSYANWAFTMLAAVFGTGALSPITAPGYSGTPIQERLITIGFMSVGIAIVAACGMILVGFRRIRQAKGQSV